MQPHEPQSVPPVCSGLKHMVKPNATKERLATNRIAVESRQNHWIEFVETDGIRTRMIFGPGNRCLSHDSRRRLAESFTRRMQREFRNCRSNRQQAHGGAATSELRIARKGACNDFECEGCSYAVANNDDFVQCCITGSRNQRFGKAVQPDVEVRPAAINVVP